MHKYSRDAAVVHIFIAKPPLSRMADLISGSDNRDFVPNSEFSGKYSDLLCKLKKGVPFLNFNFVVFGRGSNFVPIFNIF